MKYEEVSKIMEQINGSVYATIDTLSEVKLKGGKANPFHGRVTKYNTGSLVVLSNSSENLYGQLVKARMIAEGKDPEDFQLKPRLWGKRIENTSFIEHNGTIYVEVIFVKSGDSIYLVDGVQANPLEIDGLELDKPVNEESQGGIEEKFAVRTFKLDSIEKLKTDFVVFER